MCGLNGVYSTNFSQPEFDIFQKNLFLNVWRGEHSTGLIRVSEDKKAEVQKSLLASPDFLKTTTRNLAKQASDLKKPLAILGHTRHATKGAIKIENAHPFRFKNVIGMHNGTIHKHFKGRSDFETDSQAFYNLVDTIGIDEALNEIAAYDTAYAFQFVDLKEGTLNFIKNSKRPLSFTYLYAGSTLIWASERQALELVLRTKNYSANAGWNQSTTEKFFTLKDNDLLTIPLGESPKEATLRHIDVVEKKVVTSSYGSYGKSGTGSAGNSSTSGSSGTGAGSWRKTDTGYKWVPASASSTSPSTGATVKSPSGTTSPSTANQSTLPGVSDAKDKTLALPGPAMINPSIPKSSKTPEYKNHKEKEGHDALRQLSWLQPPFDGGTKGGKGETGKVPEVLEGVEAPSAGRNDGTGKGSSSSTTSGSSSSDPDAPAGSSEFDVHSMFDDLERAAGGFPLSATGRPDPALTKDESKPYRGYEGVKMTEAEFAFRLQKGCFCCGTKFNLKDPHDFEGVNSVKWWSREEFACGVCYETSDGDWVRHSIDNTWDEIGNEVAKAM